MPPTVREIPPDAQRDQRRPEGEVLHVRVVLIVVVLRLLHVQRRAPDAVVLRVQNVDRDVVQGVAAVLLVLRVGRRGGAVLVHALGCAAVPGEVLLVLPVVEAQLPRALLVGGGCDIGAVVVVVEVGSAVGSVGDGPVEGVRQFAVEGGEGVALWVAGSFQRT